MRILLSNDDGILAPGLAALRAAVADLGEITVVAPDAPKSAAGHSITLQQPLRVQHVNVGEPNEFMGLSVTGSPADCVRLAIITLLPERPQLVLSGINAGANVGINVLYSGTVAAAAEAAMLALPAVAFSAAISDGQVDYPRAGRLARFVLERLIQKGLSAGELINVNVPASRPGWPRGVRVCRQSTAGVEDVYHRQVGSDGQEAYQIADQYAFAEPHEDSDVAALREGYITITPLHVDMTALERMAELERLDWAGLGG